MCKQLGLSQAKVTERLAVPTNTVAWSEWDEATILEHGARLVRMLSDTMPPASTKPRIRR
jgi:hypothetical protein